MTTEKSTMKICKYKLNKQKCAATLIYLNCQ